MKSKESGNVRYAYGVAAALLLGGTAFSLATGEAGAQVAQNAPAQIAPRAGAPTSFADLAARESRSAKALIREVSWRDFFADVLSYHPEAVHSPIKPLTSTSASSGGWRRCSMPGSSRKWSGCSPPA